MFCLPRARVASGKSTHRRRPPVRAALINPMDRIDLFRVESVWLIEADRVPIQLVRSSLTAQHALARTLSPASLSLSTRPNSYLTPEPSS